jgi:hypothetical protein
VIRWISLFLAAFVLAGCAQMVGWVDTTGQHRSIGRARSDYKTCASEAGVAASDATYDENESHQQRLQICMYAHGWRPASLQRL